MFSYGGVNSTAKGVFTPGRIQNSRSVGVTYPSPFFDVADTYMPSTLQELFRYCKYYYLNNSIINIVISKLAAYPITDIRLNCEEPGLRKTWEKRLKEKLKYRTFQIEAGLDWNAFGNAFISVSFPFIKHLLCSGCKGLTPIYDVPDYKFRDYQFSMVCPRCNHDGRAKDTDIYIKAENKIKLIRWDPEHITLKHSEHTGVTTYRYRLPMTLLNDLSVGNRTIVENTPSLFIKAAKDKKEVELNSENIFHMRRGSISGMYPGWGIPRILPVLKDAFVLQLMMKANESILLEHILPLRVISPASADPTTNVYTTVNLSNWKQEVNDEILMWRRDPNRMPVLPLPLNVQDIGGRGRAMLLIPEIRQFLESFVAGMGCPVELALGSISWSGSNVSLRMLENDLLGYTQEHKFLLNWVIEKIAKYLDESVISADFKPFKMADDLQRMALGFQMNQAGKLSDRSMYSLTNFDPDKEPEIIQQEKSIAVKAMKEQQIMHAEAQGEAQLTAVRYQMRAQQLQQKMSGMIQEQSHPRHPEQAAGPGQSQRVRSVGEPPAEVPPFEDPMGPEMAGHPGEDELMHHASGIAAQLQDMPAEEQQMHLEQLRLQNPVVAAKAVELLGMSPEIDMRALPEQREPRRDNAII